MVYQLEWKSALAFINQADYAMLKTWKHPDPIDNWQTIPLATKDDVPPTDIYGLHGVMVWHPTVASTLEPLITGQVQLLPVTVNKMPYVADHVTQVCDCLDPQHSRFRRFKNRNIGVEHYVLQADCIGSINCFVIPDDGYSAIFVSDVLRETIIKNNWQGLVFQDVALNGDD